MYAARLALAVTLSVALGGCSTATPPASDGRVVVTAAFYPLEYLLARVGGDAVHVVNLTRPGAEPHDLELTPRDVVALGRSRLVAWEAHLQPAVDAAVEQAPPSVERVEVSGAAGVTSDPHFWLDPVRYAAVARLLADRLAALDPGHAAAYRSNLAALERDLTGLDAAYRSGLARCASRTLVTSHAAFGLMAERYGLTQVAIAGVSPDAEPSAARMAEVVADIRAKKVPTVYTETLVPALLAEVVAKETGAKVAVLDPVEGITGESAGPDYLAVMRHNLDVLKEGQSCH